MPPGDNIGNAAEIRHRTAQCACGGPASFGGTAVFTFGGLGLDPDVCVQGRCGYLRTSLMARSCRCWRSASRVLGRGSTPSGRTAVGLGCSHVVWCPRRSRDAPSAKGGRGGRCDWASFHGPIEVTSDERRSCGDRAATHRGRWAGRSGPADRSRSVTGGRGRRMVALLGPAFVAAVAYVDPGNVATNLQAGARYGYLLVMGARRGHRGRRTGCSTFRPSWASSPVPHCRNWSAGGCLVGAGCGTGCRPKAWPWPPMWPR